MSKIKIALLSVFLIFIFPLISYAEVLPDKVYAVSIDTYDSSELNEGTDIIVQTIDQYSISSIGNMEKNSIITVRVEKYIEPKRGKINGYLKVKLINHSNPIENYKIIDDEHLDIKGTLRLSTKKDKKEIAKAAGTTIVGHVLKIPGFTQAIALSKGLIKPNPEQSRLKSAGTNLYKSTPLTYIEKGNVLNIEKDSVVVLRFRE